MKYVDCISENIFYNLALEEYLFQNLKEDDYFMLWKNENSLVLGKYQNAFEEINIKEAEKSSIKVARRNSGGGTVFHDVGNLNYSIIKNIEKNSFVDYDTFLVPIINALNSLGIKAEKRRTCDIAIDGKKISGSAQTSKGGRVLHHGTLLFNSDLSLLKNMLKTTDGKIESRAVKSFRSIVTNISDYLDKETSIDEFKEDLLNKLFPNGIPKLELTNKQLEEINTIANTKYSDWQWNYGRSPEFTFEKESSFQNSLLSIKMQVKNGMISTCDVKSLNLPCDELSSKIIGSRYSYKEIFNKLNEIKFLKNINLNIEELADCFF